MKFFPFSVILIMTIMISAANAQFLPRKDSKEAIESETKKAEEVEKIAIEKQKELEEIRKLSAERIKRFDEIRKDLRKDFLSEVDDKETKEYLATFTNSNVNYWRARILYFVENYSKASASVGAVFKNDSSVFNMNGSASLLNAYIKLAREFDGEDADEKIERKLEKTLKELIEDYLPFEEKKSKDFDHYQKSRSTRLVTLKVWLSGYMTYFKQFKELRQKINDDSFQCESIWELAMLLKDKFKLSLKAQEWLEVLSKEFPNDPRIILGLDKAYYYELLAESGRLQKAVTELNTLKKNTEFNVRNFKVKKSEIEKKMKEKNLKKEDLPSDEQALLNANLDKLQETLKYYTEKLVEQYNKRIDYANQLENVKNLVGRDLNRFWGRFADWADALPGW